MLRSRIEIAAEYGRMRRFLSSSASAMSASHAAASGMRAQVISDSFMVEESSLGKARKSAFFTQGRRIQAAA
jgi:hypothetical protein